MKRKIISGIVAVSAALTAFVSLGITASATNYSSQVNASALKVNDILVGGSAKIKQDGGTTALTWKSLLKLTYQTADGKTQLNYTETEDGSTTTVYKTSRYTYWRVTSAVKENHDYTRDDYKITLTANDPTITHDPVARIIQRKDEAQTLLGLAKATNGTFQYSLNNKTWSATVPTKTDVGTYKVYYRVVGSTNYNTISDGKYVTAQIWDYPTLNTAPTGKTVEWTGGDLELVNAGTATNGTIQYSLDNSSWSTTVPTAKNVGTYTVYYKVVGNENYRDLEAASVTATIEAKAATAVYKNVGDISGAQYDGEASAWSVTVTPGSTAIESIDVKVNDKTSEEGAWTDTVLFGGSVTFGVAIDAAADKIDSIKAVVNGSDIETTLID